MPREGPATSRNNAKDSSASKTIDPKVDSITSKLSEADPRSARAAALKLILGVMQNNPNAIIRMNEHFFGSEAAGKFAFRQELKKIMFEEAGEIPIIAAYLLLEFDLNDQAAMRLIVTAIEGNDKDLCSLAATYCGRLPKVPAQAIPGLVKLLHGEDVRLLVGAAVALRDASPGAIAVLVHLLRGDDQHLRMLAASALGRVEEHARPTVGMDEIIAALTDRLEALDELGQFIAIALIREMGPAAALAVPTLIKLLPNPQVIKAGARTVIIDLLGNTGHKNETMKALTRALGDAIFGKNWLGVIIATESMAALGDAPAKAIDDLLALLRKPDKDSQMCALKALRAFGPALAPATEALIDLINHVDDQEVAAAWAMTMEAIGPSAVRPLLQLIRTASVEVLVYAAAALQGTCPEGSAEFVNLLLTDPNKGTREFAAVFLSTRGKKAEMAVPAIVKLLEGEDGEKHVEAAVMALRGLGVSARSAAPVLARFLAGGSAWTKELAAEGLTNIGPEAIPSLRQAHEHADAEGKERIAEILGKWDFVIEKPSSGLEWYGNDKKLTAIAKVLEMLKEIGPTSAAKIAKKLKVGRSTVREWLKEFEERLESHRGTAVCLVERQSTKAMNIAKDGHEFLAEIQAYLARRRADGNTKGVQKT